jgi:hypothetical protein
MSVMLMDVWRAARARAVPFSGETAGFVALAVCEEIALGAREVDLHCVELAGDGHVHIGAAAAADEARAERALRALLGRLLEVASSPGPALFRAAGRPSPAGVAALGAELRQALIPFNRAAARRALLRLYRETERAVASGRLGALPEAGDGADSLRVSPPPPPSRELTPSVVLPLVSAQPVVARPPAQPATEHHLTRPETVVAMVKRGQRPSPPPLPPSRVPESAPNTPRMGSMDVDVVLTPRTPVPPPLPEFPDLTEQVPEAFERPLAADGPSPSSVTPLLDLAVLPNLQRMSAELPGDEELAQLPPVTMLPPAALLTPGRENTVEDLSAEALSEQSPALIVGFDVHDSDEIREAVGDDELETRPLRSTIPAPYAGMPPEPSHVHDLLQGFKVADGLDEHELRHELKALAGVDCTPGYAVRVRSR